MAPLEMGIHLPVKFSKDRIISLRIWSGFPQDLAYILNRVCKIFWPTKIASEWPLFSKLPPTKSAKFQCSLISKIPRPDGTSWDGDPPSCEV
jgi:hypothetical protein